MKSKILFFSLIILGYCASLNSLKAQSTKLGQANFPQNGDSLSHSDFSLSPIQTFSLDSIADQTKDTISLQRSVMKALIKFGDTTNMSNAPSQSGYQTWKISIPYYIDNSNNENDYSYTYKTPTSKTPGKSHYGAANLYYIFQDTTVYYETNNANGLYNVGFYINGAVNMSYVTQSAKSPMILYPLSSAKQNDVPVTYYTGTFWNTLNGDLPMGSNTKSTVDAWGKLTVYPPSPAKAVTYDSTVRVVTIAIDSIYYIIQGTNYGTQWLNTITYNWYAKGTPEALFSYSYVQSRNSLYAYWSTPADGWVDAFDLFYVDGYKNVNIGINELAKNDASVNIYPNPTDGIVNLKMDNMNGKSALVQVTDILGNVVVNKEISGASNVIDLSNEAKGVYMLKLTSDSMNYTKKIVVK